MKFYSNDEKRDILNIALGYILALLISCRKWYWIPFFRFFILKHLFKDRKLYFGFQKWRLNHVVARPLLQSLGLAPGDLQIEIALINDSSQLSPHIHKDSYAVVYCLHKQFGFSNPKKGHVLLGDTWKPFKKDQREYIPPGTIHHFECEPGGRIVFISIQGPEIENRETGNDDFHIVDPIPVKVH